jgi:thymidine phosphorylase
MHAKPGDAVTAGAPVMTLHTDNPALFDFALDALEGGWSVAPSGTAVEGLPLVIDRIADA